MLLWDLAEVKGMAIDLDEVFSKGGKPSLDVLHYCVLAVQPEPLFAFLVRDYAAAPTAAKAVALYDVFCDPGAEARLGCVAALPPRELRLAQLIAPLRQALQNVHKTPADADNPTFVPLPPRHLFDELLRHVRDMDTLKRLADEYDPSRTPQENLPGGKMNAGQRFFVERVWRPRLRPRLVAAGFWRLATVAG
jgi:hypothetical protein